MYILCSITVLLTFKPAYKSTVLLCRSCAFQDIETFLDNPMFATGAHGTKCKLNGSHVPPGRKSHATWPDVMCHLAGSYVTAGLKSRAHLAGCCVPPGRKLRYSLQEVTCHLAGCPVPPGRKLRYSWAEVMRNLAGSHVPAGRKSLVRRPEVSLQPAENFAKAHFGTTNFLIPNSKVQTFSDCDDFFLSNSTENFRRFCTK